MIDSYSAFIYGHAVDSTNNYIDWDIGGSEISVQMNVGEYSLTDFCTEIARAMNSANQGTYAVTVNRTTGIITVTKSAGTFRFLASTGSHVGTSVFSLMGFAAVDGTLAASQTGSLRSGSLWLPQFKAQDFVHFDNQQSAVDGSVKKSASGRVEAVSFGNQKLMDCNFKFITNIQQTLNDLIVSDSSGVENARAFMEYAVTKKDMEFIPDRNDYDTYYKVILESTPESQDGLGFKLKEQYQNGLRDYYETGVLKFRLIS